VPQIIEASFWYGKSRYPINTEELPAIDLHAVIDPIITKLSELSGGHHLDEHPKVAIAITGNGYTYLLSTELE
jgi:hypothetical protein